MLSEDEPVSPDEWVLRLIWRDYFKLDLALQVQPAAVEPRKNETGGISVFRVDCLNETRDALAVIAGEKRALYAIALLPIADLVNLGLTVRAAKIDVVPGHAIVPELNIASYKAGKKRCKTLQKQLAEIASQHVVLRSEA